MCTETMLWSAVFVCVLGPVSVLTSPTTIPAATSPPAANNTTKPQAANNTTSAPAANNPAIPPGANHPTAPTVALPPGELEIILDTLLTQVDRQNTWLETLQSDVYGLGDSVEMHSLDLQELRQKVHRIHMEDNKLPNHNHEERIDSEESVMDTLSQDKSWDKDRSKLSEDSSYEMYDNEDLELFMNKEKEFVEKYHTNGNNRGRNARRGGYTDRTVRNRRKRDTNVNNTVPGSKEEEANQGPDGVGSNEGQEDPNEGHENIDEKDAGHETGEGNPEEIHDNTDVNGEKDNAN